MPRKSKKPVRKQTDSPTVKVVGQVSQILLGPEARSARVTSPVSCHDERH